MKFKFKIQQYQTDAVNAVVRVFEGQPKLEGKALYYTRDLGVQKPKEATLYDALKVEDEEDINGVRNGEIRISKNAILANIQRLQDENDIAVSDRLSDAHGICSLDVEMDTGTGKTYVYTKTMFELNRQYGWSKFIVVVPSIAIREGVKKSFEQTEEHFFEEYKKKARYFIYNSKNLNDIDRFSTDSGINVMIINIQAFNTRGADGRLIYEELDAFNSRKPIDVIKANNPILILDEPQKMGGKATQTSLDNFNPLFTINYSATHKDVHNPIFVLDALQAYNRKLVKKIVVKGFELKNLSGTGAYMLLEEIKVSKEAPYAKLNLEINRTGGIKRETKSVYSGDNLYELTRLEQYSGFVVNEIDAISNTLSFTNGQEISVGVAVNDSTEENMRRIQIRETIKSHFEMEKKLYRKGIKTLSLFFIDEVAKYRQYDKDGNEINGEYGRMFEEEYNRVLNEQKDLYDQHYMKYLNSITASKTHSGYFSIDKKTGHKIDSAVKRGAEDSDDISAYDLILKNKERLLSFEEPVRFIFSHSALSEGWDNPNVFQICTLKHSSSTVRKRQEVGRGMRLCVDKNGNRMDAQTCGSDFHNINRLTVIANESYSTFARDLQNQIKEVLYKWPTMVTDDFFVNRKVAVETADGNYVPHELTARESVQIYDYCINNGYIDKKGHITEKYRNDLNEGKEAKLPGNIEPYRKFIHQHLQNVFDEKTFDKMIEDGHKAKITENKLNDNIKREEFKKLWSIIEHKYVYNVDYDSEKLIESSIEALGNELKVTKLQYYRTTGEQKAEMRKDDVERGISFDTKGTKREIVEEPALTSSKYDLIGKIASETVLTRRTVAAILTRISNTTFNQFAVNPEDFIRKTCDIIKSVKADLIVDNVVYKQTDGVYETKIFEDVEEHDYSKSMKTSKHVTDYLCSDGQLDSNIERKFAEALEASEEVCVYAKLPRTYKIPTPLGDYSPDWAICFKPDANHKKHVYFIAETKGSSLSSHLRKVEEAKIKCARKLFADIGNDSIGYDVVASFEQLLEKLE